MNGGGRERERGWGGGGTHIGNKEVVNQPNQPNKLTNRQTINQTTQTNKPPPPGLSSPSLFMHSSKQAGTIQVTILSYTPPKAQPPPPIPSSSQQGGASTFPVTLPPQHPEEGMMPSGEPCASTWLLRCHCRNHHPPPPPGP